MKQRLNLIALLLFVLGSVNGQEKIFYDAEGNKTYDMGSAVEYKITEKSVVGADSLFIKTAYFMSGQKKSENSFLKVYKKGKFIEQKFIGENWEWFENGGIKLSSFYKNGQLQGAFSTYWQNGIQRRKDLFDNGKLIEGNCYDSIGNKITEYFPYQTIPEFPGGEQKLFSYLISEVKYPIQAQEKNIQGRVLVQFYVETDGKISNIKILNNNNYYLEMESLRVIKAMPDWTPGTIEGQKVKVKFTLPVSFRMQ